MPPRLKRQRKTVLSRIFLLYYSLNSRHCQLFFCFIFIFFDIFIPFRAFNVFRPPVYFAANAFIFSQNYLFRGKFYRYATSSSKASKTIKNEKLIAENLIKYFTVLPPVCLYFPSVIRLARLATGVPKPPKFTPTRSGA